MNGQYPGYSNTGTSGANAIPKDAKHFDSPGAKTMTAWFDFMSNTRYWELEPYFDVDGGRAVALEEIEYIVYVEKPSGPVELQVEQHSYDVYWINPVTGESTKLKNFKGEKFVSEPPDKTHDWILHLSRDGKKQSMLTSYKFESRPTPVQERGGASAESAVRNRGAFRRAGLAFKTFQIRIKGQARLARDAFDDVSVDR